MDFTGPFHAPRMPTEEFEKRKAAYNAKHGYTVSLPDISDVIILKREPELTPAEEVSWMKKDYSGFSEKRLEEIYVMKKRRKEKFLQMMGSPSPHYIRAAGSIMCALDDAQDALNTVAVGAAVVGTAVPTPATPFLYSAAGFLLTTGAVLNLAQFLVGAASGARLPKASMKGMTDMNPFSKTAKMKRMAKVKKAIPTIGDYLQAAQVSKDVFGVGLCLGPAMGFIQDFTAGAVRMALGQKVRMTRPAPYLSDHERTALRTMKSSCIAAQESGYHSDPSDAAIYAGIDLASQVTSQISAEWNASDEVQDLHLVESEAPRPRNILTIECFEEEGLNVNNHIAWPNVGKRWATYTEINKWESVPARRGFDGFCKKEKNTQSGFFGAGCATGALFQMLANAEGADAVEYDFIAAQRVTTRLLDAGLALPPTISVQQRSCYEKYLEAHDKNRTCPTANEAVRYCKNTCGFAFDKIPKYANP